MFQMHRTVLTQWINFLMLNHSGQTWVRVINKVPQDTQLLGHQGDMCTYEQFHSLKGDWVFSFYEWPG